MNLRKRLRGCFRTALIVVLPMFSALSAAPRPCQPIATEGAGGGLRITIYPDRTESRKSKVQNFRVELSNVGPDDLILNLGFMAGNGRKQYASKILLNLTDMAGKSRRLELMPAGIIGGRVDPMIVPLPMGSTFSILVDMDNYWDAASSEFAGKLKPRSYSVEAQFEGAAVSQQETSLDMQAVALMPYWTGTVTSNRVRVEVPGR
jgi:hypothetical protein